MQYQERLMNMKNRWFSACLIIMLTLLCACSPGTPMPSATSLPPPPAPPVAVDEHPLATGDRYAESDGKTTTVRWLIPVMKGTNPYQMALNRVEAFLSRINTKLEPYDLSLDIELRNVTLERVIADDDRRYKGFSHSITNELIAILASHEEYDLISAPTGFVSLSKLVDLGLLRNITSDMQGYEHLMAMLDERQLASIRYAGGIWGVPTGFDATANMLAPYLAYNTAIAETLGVFDATTLSSAADLLYTAERAGNSDLLHSVYIDHTLDAYRREYPQFPFKVSEDYLFLFTQDGKVERYAGSPVMSADIDLANQIWRINGTSDSVTRGMYSYESTERSELTMNKSFDFVQGLLHVPTETDDSFAPLLLAEEKPVILYDNPNGHIVNVIPAQASAYGLMLLDIIYGNRDIYEEFRDEAELFGGSSEDFGIVYDWSPATTVQSTYFMGLESENIRGRVVDIYHYSLFDCVKQSVLDPNQAALRYADLVKDAIYTPMPWDGFVFDPAPVLKDYIRVAERSWGWNRENEGAMSPNKTTNIPDIFLGRNPGGNLSEMAVQIEEAGMPTVLAECQRQYAEFLMQKGWVAPAPSN